MADLMKFSNRVLYCNLNLMRVVQDWGLESLSNFMDIIYGISMRGWEDKMCWKSDKRRGFEVSGYYWVWLIYQNLIICHHGVTILCAILYFSKIKSSVTLVMRSWIAYQFSGA